MMLGTSLVPLSTGFRTSAQGLHALKTKVGVGLCEGNLLICYTNAKNAEVFRCLSLCVGNFRDERGIL